MEGCVDVECWVEAGVWVEGWVDLDLGNFNVPKGQFVVQYRHIDM